MACKTHPKKCEPKKCSFSGIDAYLLTMNVHILSILSFSIVTVNCRTSCNTVLYSSGCEDNFGSFCNNNSSQCECKTDYTVDLRGRFCLKARNLSESCFISDQCLSNSKCFSNYTELVSSNVQYWIRPEVPLSPEGKCLCPQNYFQNKYNVCELRKSFGESCDRDHECDSNSFCNSTTQKCECSQVYSSVIEKCVKGRYLAQSCHGREECQYYDKNSLCVDGICLCDAGYTKINHNLIINDPHKTLAHCVLDTLVYDFETVEPKSKTDENVDSNFDLLLLIIIIAFLLAFIIAIVIARRNRNSIMQIIRPNELNGTSESHVVMLPIDNCVNPLLSGSFNT